MKKEILELLDKEIEFAKGCGMPQFVMGLIQARKVAKDAYEREEPTVRFTMDKEGNLTPIEEV